MPHKFRELKVWQKDMDLAVDVYRFSREFPSDKRFALTNQIRRAANSVPLNIAEGSGYRTDREFTQFLGVAFRSCSEVVTGIELAARLGYAERDAAQSLVAWTEELASMLMGLMRKLDGRQGFRP